MSTNPRETQFVGFAKLLYEDFLRQAEDEASTQDIYMPDYPDKWRVIVEQIIAERAYDLVVHVLGCGIPQWMPLEEVSISQIPDLTQWPEN